MVSKKLTKEKGRKAAIYKSEECLNCGLPLELTDKYCSNCSQLNSTKQLSINDFFNEFFSSLFTYDSRLRYTLKDLLFKPGVITRNYVAGQRLKYANPFRFYLSVSIIYFILQSFSTGNDLLDIDLDIDTPENSEIISETLDSTSIKKDNYFDSESFNKELDSIISNRVSSKEITIKNDTIVTYLSEAELDTIPWSNRMMERFFLYREFYNNTKIENPVKALDSLKHPVNRVNKWVYSKNKTIDRIVENPENFINFLMQKIPFFLFFFAPFYAFFFWIIYSMKKYNYMEHLVFIFHIFSFSFLAAIIAYFPDLLFRDSNIVTAIVYLIIGPFYFYKALRNFYKQKRAITLFKFVVLNLIFFIGSLITATLFFTATAAVY
ncbi:MAG: DUF3667 domain-containing protein [Flavobacteriaceae bacterium]|nr:DUF3667 domain-containing protein [Flavobacteriaceae bacterium]